MSSLGICFGLGHGLGFGFGFDVGPVFEDGFTLVLVLALIMVSESV